MVEQSMSKVQSVVSTIGLALVVLAGCSNPPPAAAPTNAPAVPPTPTAFVAPTSTPAVSPTPTASVAQTPAAQSSIDDLPEFIRVLSPEYHAAYRLAARGPWAKKYLAAEVASAGMEFDEWDRLPWNDGTGTGLYHKWGPGMEFNWGRALKNVERDPEDNEWLTERITLIDQDIGQQFRLASSISERLELLEQLVTAEGRYIKLELVFVEWEGRLLDSDEETIARVVESTRDHLERMQVYSSLPMKEGILHHIEIALCNLIMYGVANQDSGPVIVDGRCDMVLAMSLAEEALAANGGQFAWTEEDFREMLERH